ncbi:MULTISPECIES: PAM68 family protein [unclassified Synechocystis]|uniref:PAM68 family protein n=1 Tax=unclassified Synechocystis TaxID=2640012 RepID=UPI0004016881|nr:MULTISPECIES: PAM68 family protein [unclassified Synechocystis]AIE74640.1 ABC-type Co2+ transport system, permease component [Synechocystis sp. PCC 6714]MCT0254001.1 PAM68 family protein [Synechocystis sp. CS-94]
MADPTNQDRLPFERKSKKKKVEKKPPSVAAPSNKTSGAKEKKSRRSADSGIPAVVSQRMVKRMALFSGIPTGLGMLSFVLFYLVVSRDWFEIPTYVVFAVSLLFFGLGVVGLSYGIFSTSWEDEPGSVWGWSEFRLNLGRTIAVWRNAQQTAQDNGDR